MSDHPHVMRLLEERHVSIKIGQMVWSTKMDLLALSYASGEVALHRLNWLKVWVLPPPAESVTVKSIAWRPDGKVIAIGYSNRELVLVSVEQRDVLSRTEVEADITCILWSDDRIDEKVREIVPQKTEPYHVFLPKLQKLSRSSDDSHVSDAKGIESQKDLNILFIGLSNGRLLISVFGLYPRVSIDIQGMLNSPDCIILAAGSSKSQDVLLVIVLINGSVAALTIDTPLLNAHDGELITLAHKYGHISSCLDYMDLTLRNIIESWENIMMEMDFKLRKYANKVTPGRVSCDFLELLMFGTASQEMSEFLLDDMTEKGLKKLNQSMELSYDSIQSLVLKHLQSVGQNLAFQLAELCGLARCPVYSQVMGFSENDVMAAFSTTGSFLIKVSEVQHVIDESLNKYKAFFRWLYATFLRLCEERVTTDTGNMSQVDLQYIVDFIDGMEDSEGKFNLDRLGQYLANAPLDTPSAPAEAWENLLKKHPALSEMPFIIKHNNDLSLVQEASLLREKVGEVFKKAEKAAEQHFKLKHVSNIPISSDISSDVLPKVTHSYVPEQLKFMIAIADPLRPEGYHFMEAWTNEDTPCHTFVELPQKVVDIQFYTPEVLSLLLDMSPEPNAGFAQVKYRNVGEPCSMRTIHGMIPAKFAVCGTRKVAVVLSESRRKVKIFEMDVEVEEEDDEEGMDTTNSSARETDLDLSGRAN